MNTPDERAPNSESADPLQSAMPDAPEATAESSSEFAANGIRLGLGEWLSVLVLVLLITAVAPALSSIFEPLPRGAFPPHYRLPYALSEDYWLYQKHVTRACRDKRIVAIGDSVIWGEYVRPSETLTHFLNANAPANRHFANAGLNGSHPLALEGLVECHTSRLRNAAVLLHANLLWMSSPERDLQTSKEQPFNHPQLVPQLWRSPPAYRATGDQRLGAAIDQRLNYRQWVRHLRVAYLDGMDLHGYSLEHPYQLRVPPPQPPGFLPEDAPHSRPIVWTDKGIPLQDFEWVPADRSLQWKAFQRTVQLLKARGNRVFVLVGPFNEHLLTEASRKRYGKLKDDVSRWLEQQQVPHLAPAVLASDQYGDASHPLAAGYKRLAGRLHASAAFRWWLEE